MKCIRGSLSYLPSSVWAIQRLRKSGTEQYIRIGQKLCLWSVFRGAQARVALERKGRHATEGHTATLTADRGCILVPCRVAFWSVLDKWL